MNQQQKRYATKRTEEVAEAAIRKIYAVESEHTETLEQLKEERGKVRSDLTGIRPASPAVLKAKLAYAIEQAGDEVFDERRYHQAQVLLADLVVTDREKEVKVLDQSIKNIEALIDDEKKEKRAKKHKVEALATATKDAIMLGADGLVALEEFTAKVEELIVA